MCQSSRWITYLRVPKTIIEAIVMLQCKAAGGVVSGHVCCGLGVHHNSAVHESGGTAVCGANMAGMCLPDL